MTSGVLTIANDAITTVKVLDASITPIKINLGSANQIFQTSSTLINNWVSMSGDATLTNGAITIANNAITAVKILNGVVSNAKLTNSSLTVGSTSLSLGGTYSYIGGSLTLGSSASVLKFSGIVEVDQTAGQTFKVGVSSATGMINLVSKPAGITYSSAFKQNGLSTSIDSEGFGTLDLNTASTFSTVNIGGPVNVNSTFNLLDEVSTFNSTRFNNISTFSFTTMAYTASIGLTSWTTIGHSASASLLQTSITIRGRQSSRVRVTINLPLSYWGTASSNHHLSIRRSTTAMYYSTTYATESVGANYGLHHILSGVQYDACNASFIDTSATTFGTTYYYCVVARSSTVATVSANIGNSSYADIAVEELY
jgi:hypothetical protein